MTEEDNNEMETKMVSDKDSDGSCFQKNKTKIIIAAIVSLVVIVIAVVLIVLLTKGDSEQDEEKKDEDKKKKYEYGLSMDELKSRTSQDNLITFEFLKPDSTEYTSLQEGDKTCLKYLVKAGAILEKIQLRIDDVNNIPFKEFLEEEVKEGSEEGKLTKILFDGQKGINAIDKLGQEIFLMKGKKIKPGMGVYPEDITQEELHRILIQMLNEGKIEEVQKILNQRSIVERDGAYLKSTDYVDYFRDDFAKIADLLDEAAKYSTNINFTEYLQLQAKAFRKADPILDAYADIKWAELQDTPLELTITRENYHDELTGKYIENEELKKLINKYNISVVSKDSLGFRIGIINKEGTDDILSIKKYLKLMADNMPYKEKYNQTIGNDTKQTMVDVDLIMLAGDCGAYRAGITLAENLPNDDKLSLTMGGGKRNVYHRQIRQTKNPDKIKKMLDSILVEEQHQYYDVEADHWFTICHENTHSLGPVIKNSALGDYTHIVEENKADMGGLIFLDLLVNEKYYTEEQKKKIIVTFIVDSFMNEKPILSQAHWVRSVMQNYYQFKNGGYELRDEKIFVNIDKVEGIAQEMMKEIIMVQLENDFEKGKKYVEDYFVWNTEQEIIGKKKLALGKTLNGIIKSELADKLLEEN